MNLYCYKQTCVSITEQSMCVFYFNSSTGLCWGTDKVRSANLQIIGVGRVPITLPISG